MARRARHRQTHRTLLPQANAYEMVRFRIDQGEPASRPQYPRRLGEIPRGEYIEDEVDGGILHRLVGPQIGDGEGQAGPAARRQARGGRRDVEPEAGRPRAERGGDAGEVAEAAPRCRSTRMKNMKEVTVPLPPIRANNSP
jgi:hypothetical protein